MFTKMRRLKPIKKFRQFKRRRSSIKLDSRQFWNFLGRFPNSYSQADFWLAHSKLWFDLPKCHLETFASNTSAKAQSFILCLIGVVLCPNLRSSSSSRAAATRLVQHKDTLIKIIKLADSNSVICRSKSFLVLYLILNMQPDLLLAACKHKVRSDIYLEPNDLRKRL